MEAYDPRTRSKVALNSERVLTSSLPSRLLTQLILSNLAVVFVLTAGKEWILDSHISPLWLAVRVLGCGSMGAVIWVVAGGNSMPGIEWSTVGRASLLTVVQQVATYTMLQRISAIRTSILIQSSMFILQSVMKPTSTRRFSVGILILLVILISSRFSMEGVSRTIPVYVALGLHALSTNALETTWQHIEPILGQGFTYSATTGGAFVIAGLLYGLGLSTSIISEAPFLPLSSFLPIPFIAMAFLYASPRTSRIVRDIGVSTSSYYYLLCFSCTTAFAIVFGCLAFHQPFSFVDILLASLVFYGCSSTTDGVQASNVSRIARAYLNTILSNPESRKIFYFLMLNISYMGVQVVYGVITNSLGLISDAIHMAFDCMAIAMGLFASVAATWMPNEQYTYGYGRIETLSGFANGIFLLLISIFIVFEAIQRLLDPPEMSTNQLLLVSTLGLCVNLFGMFAMGGHHHGGHSHSHGAHSHGSHVDPPGAHDDHVHSVNSHSHSSHQHDRHHDHDHGNHTHNHSPHSSSHSHSPSHSPDNHHHHSFPNTTHPTVSDTSYDSRNRFPPSPIHKRNESRSENLHPLNSASLGPPSIPETPITPGYRFGQDDHFAEHHHSHHVPNSHDHAHYPVVHEGHSHNMRGVFLHVMADTLGSVGVIISTLLIQFYGWTGFDPIASLFIAVLIVASVIPLVIDSGRVLALDAGDRENNIQHALKELAEVEGVTSYTQPRFWPKDASSLIGSIHIQLKPSPSSLDPHGPHPSRGASFTNVDRVLERVDTLLRGSIKGLEELTIQVESAEGR